MNHNAKTTYFQSASCAHMNQYMQSSASIYNIAVYKILHEMIIYNID